MKILILKPSSLGDVVQALPVLRMLKRHWPLSEIHWWIDTDLAEVLDGDPDLSGVIRFDRRRWTSPRNWLRAWVGLRRLREQSYDLVLDLQALLRSSVVAWLSRGRQVVGLQDPREGAPAFYDRGVPRASRSMHAVDWYLQVLPMLGVPIRWDFDWLPERPAARASLLRKWPAEGVSWVAVHPSARWENKRWPASYFAELLARLSREVGPGVRFALIGGRSDRDVAEEICRAAPDRCLNLAGQTNLGEMIEWLRRSRILISNDSGPMHVAVALGRPVVAVFGPTDPRRTGPYGQGGNVLRADVACAPCLKSRCHSPRQIECLRQVAPGVVLQRVLAQMASPRRPDVAEADLSGIPGDRVCPLPVSRPQLES